MVLCVAKKKNEAMEMFGFLKMRALKPPMSIAGTGRMAGKAAAAVIFILVVQYNNVITGIHGTFSQ